LSPAGHPAGTPARLLNGVVGFLLGPVAAVFRLARSKLKLLGVRVGKISMLSAHIVAPCMIVPFA